MQGLNFSVKKRRKAFLCLENVSVWVVYNHDNRIISNHITCYLNPVFHYKILSDSYHKQQANYRSSCSHYKNTKKIYVCEQIGNFCLEYIHVILYIHTHIQVCLPSIRSLRRHSFKTGNAISALLWPSLQVDVSCDHNFTHLLQNL